jgi:hypothetical protein
VIAITTAHSVHREKDRIERLRRRPKATSTNAAITWPVFEGRATKWLQIPKAIDDYNHGMNGVDLGSQLRGGFSCHKPYEAKWWRPICWWLLDICSNNAFLIWKTTQKMIDHKLHQRFQDRLIHDLLNYDRHTPALKEVSEHHWEPLLKKRQCAYGLKVRGGCVQGDSSRPSKRRCLGEISGNVRTTTKPREVRTGCKQCAVPLCIDRACWRSYHGVG